MSSVILPEAKGVRTALITGIAGQDGFYLREQLAADGTQVHGLVRPSEFEAVPEQDRSWHYAVDITDGPAVAELIDRLRPSEIYNLAGISSVAQSWEQPALTGQVSGVAVANVLQAALRLQETTGETIHVVQASSAEIFGAAKDVPQNESTPIRPTSPYGAAKAYAHHLVQIYRSRGLFASTCILYNHESPRRPQTFVTRKITSAAAAIARGRQENLLLGNLDARRDWGWAPDYVDAMVRAARHSVSGDYVIATGQARTVRDFVASAMVSAGVSDWKDRVSVDPKFARPADSPEMVGDWSHARIDLGWQPTRSFEQIVGSMVDHDLALLDG